MALRQEKDRIRAAAIVFATVTLVFAPRAMPAAESASVAAAKVDDKHRSIALAVFPLTASAPDDHFKPLVDGIAEMLMAHLARYPNLKLVERVELDKILKEQALGLLEKPDEQVKLGKMLKAQYVIVGGVVVDGKKLIINVRALEVGTARVAGAAKGTCSGDAILETLGKIGDKLIQEMSLDLPALPKNRVDPIAGASLHFMRGLGFYFAQMPEHATAQFMQTLAIEPGHAGARWWNAQVYFEGKEYAHARVELTRFLHDHAEHPDAARAKDLLARCEPSTSSGK